MPDGLNALIATAGGYQAPDPIAYKGNALNLQKGELGLQWMKEDRLREMEMRPLKDTKEAVSLLHDVIPMIDYDNYEASYDHLNRVNGINRFFPLPTPEQVRQLGRTGWEEERKQFYSPEVQAKFAEIVNKGWTPRTKQDAMDVRAAGRTPEENKSKTEEQLTRISLYDPDPNERAQAQDILDAMQKRKIATAQAMPATTVYVGDVGGKPAVTSGTKGSPTIKTLETPGGEPVLPKGSEKLSETQQKTIKEISKAKSLVDTLKSMWDPIAPNTRAEGVWLYKQAKLGENKEAKAYMDERDAFLGVISRALGGEVGVLTDQDIKRVGKALAKIGINPFDNDTKDEATEKWNTIYKIIDEAEQQFVNSLSAKTKSEAIEQIGKKPKKIGRFTVEVK